ncbi:MAG: class I SAM-dependent methyltransferase [Desulfovibrio sp.]
MLAYFRGIFYLLLSKIKYHLTTYTPKIVSDCEACINYDFSVVEAWIAAAQRLDPEFTLQGRTVLEIGPGADLGIATILLSKGIKRYYAYDIHDLLEKVQPEFYDRLVQCIGNRDGCGLQSATQLLDAASEYSRTGDGTLNYICKDCIDFLEIPDGAVDVVFSQAALEHVQDLEALFTRLAPKCRPGALLVAEVDLKAHSRWVRDYDPLNIYIYNQELYRLLSHPATPNRVRPREYAAHLKKTGWTDIQIIPLKTADKDYVDHIRPSIQPRFRDNDLSCLSILLLAKKGEQRA